MAKARIRNEDMAGLALALLAHAVLIGWLAWSRPPPAPPVVDKVMVTLSGEIADQASSTSREAAAAAIAPKLAEEPAPAPEPAALAPPVARVTPLPKAASVSRPAPAPRLAPAPQPQPAPKQARATPSRVGNDFLKGVADSRQRPAQRAGGGSRIGDDFLKGVANADNRGKSQTPPGPVITAQVRSSLGSEVSRQLKPHWQSPDGVDVDKLATTLEWDLNPDGTLAGAPRFVGQTGVNNANRAQADRHREQAIRAVRLSAPFHLPPQFYAGWQRLRFTFDWKLN
jgi:hypothetical protein